MRTLKAVFVSLRPKQWTKNLLVFAGILFSQNFFVLPMLVSTIAAFVIFCFLSGAVYIFNDVTDIEKDKKHPLKSKRPLASGELSVKNALISSRVTSRPLMPLMRSLL